MYQQLHDEQNNPVGPILPAREVNPAEVPNPNFVPRAFPLPPPVNLNFTINNAPPVSTPVPIPVASAIALAPEPSAPVSQRQARRQEFMNMKRELRERRVGRNFDCSRYMREGWLLYKSNCCVLTGGTLFITIASLLVMAITVFPLLHNMSCGMDYLEDRLVTGEVGSNVCPTGSSPLSFWECKQAAYILDLDDDYLQDVNLPEAPPGCFMGSVPGDDENDEKHVWYNSLQGKGQANSESQLICKSDMCEENYDCGGSEYCAVEQESFKHDDSRKKHGHQHRDHKEKPKGGVCKPRSAMGETCKDEFLPCAEDLACENSVCIQADDTSGKEKVRNWWKKHNRHHSDENEDENEDSDDNDGDDNTLKKRGHHDGWMMWIGIALATIFLVPAKASYMIAIMNAMRNGGNVNCKDFFSAFTQPGYWCRLLVLTTVISVVTHLGFYSFVLPGIWFSFAMVFVIPFHREKPMLGLCGSMYASFIVTHSYFCPLLGFLLLIGVINFFVALFTFGFGLLFSVPFTVCSFLYCYNHLVGVNNVADAPAWENRPPVSEEMMPVDGIPVAYAIEDNVQIHV